MAVKEYEYFEGTVKFINQNTPNEWNKWAIVIYLDNDNRDKLIDLQAQGVKNTLKKDEGGYYTTFSRPSFKEYQNGDKQEFDPPVVYDADGNKTGVLIGRGSKVNVRVEVYSHPIPNSKQRGKALRWEAVKVLELKQDTKKETQDEGPEPIW